MISCPKSIGDISAIRGDGTDETDNIQALIDSKVDSGDHCLNLDGKEVLVRELFLPDRFHLQGCCGKISYFGSGNTCGALIASKAWSNGFTFANSRQKICGLEIDSLGLPYSVILKCWRSSIRDCEIYGASDTNYLHTTVSKNGELLPQGTSMVEIDILDSEIGRPAGTARAMHVRDTQNAITDGTIDNLRAIGDVIIENSAGWDVNNLHHYARGSVSIERIWHSTKVTNCYFEADVKFSPAPTLCSYAVGTNNRFLSNAEYNFNDTCRDVKSNGNVYGPNATITHNATLAGRDLYSMNDIYQNPTPLIWTGPNSTELRNSLVKNSALGSDIVDGIYSSAVAFP